MLALLYLCGLSCVRSKEAIKERRKRKKRSKLHQGRGNTNKERKLDDIEKSSLEADNTDFYHNEKATKASLPG